MLDGWRGEVFAALYSPAGERIWEPAVYRPEELAERVAELGETPVGRRFGGGTISPRAGPDGVRIADDSDPVHRVAARHVCALAARGGREDRDGLAPIYLRPPDAERWRERDAFQRAE